jgi:cell division septum initiation protein DivIVA
MEKLEIALSDLSKAFSGFGKPTDKLIDFAQALIEEHGRLDKKNQELEKRVKATEKRVETIETMIEEGSFEAWEK